MKKKYIIKKARKLLVEQINSHQTIVRNDMNNIETMSNMKGLSEVIPKDNDGYCTIYKMDCADGLGLMTVYQVFPGIQLIYNDFEATEYEWESILDKDILEINHCREGREGSRLLSGSCLYLGEGDLSIHTMDNCASEMSFPLKHYRGISVVINLTTVSKNSPEILMEAGIDILAFRNKFCASGDCFIMRAKDEIEHIFSELYSIPDCLQKPYMKLKVQELLLFLYTVDAAKEKQRERYTSPHVEIVKEIHKKLVSDLQKRPTIEELSNIFLSQQEKDVENINLVTPTSYVPQIIEAIKIARKKGLEIPIVYNTNGYESVETLKLLEGYVDIYLPDLKYYYDDLAKKYSKVDNYFEIATKAIQEMYRQVGTPVLDENGVMKKGLMIRHLILPNEVQNSKKVLKWIKENIDSNVYVSIMAQYFPTYKAKEIPEIARKITKEEYEKVENYLYELDLENGYIQELGDHEEEYVPNFNGKF